MNQNKKPECKVCRDAGKPESVYTSHYVKSMNRCQIICPTLLSIKCRYCEEIGHTVKYCKSLNNQPSRSYENQPFKRLSQTDNQPSRSYEKVSQTDNQPFERLSQPSRRLVQPSRSAYEPDKKTKNQFDILEDDEEEIEQPLTVSSICNVVGSYAAALARQQEPFRIPTIPVLVRNDVKKRWADYDSDDDDDSISNCY